MDTIKQKNKKHNNFSNSIKEIKEKSVSEQFQNSVDVNSIKEIKEKSAKSKSKEIGLELCFKAIHRGCLS